MAEIFLNRVQQLELLSKRASALKDGYRQNMAILGDELVGKTALAFRFLELFCDCRILTAYIEVRPETVLSFAQRFIGTILYSFLANSGIALKEDLEFLLQKSERYIPRTVTEARLILANFKKKKNFNLFIGLVSLTDSIYEETGKSCVVIFDEFHNLENLGIKKIYSEWAKVLVTQKNTMYIAISSRKARAKAILAKELSLLFGNFEVIALEPFDNKESERFLEGRFAQTPLEAGLRNFIVNFTGGHTFYLDVISSAVLKSSSQDLAGILEGILFEPSGLLHQRFSNYLKNFFGSNLTQEYLAILYQVSSGRNKINEIIQSLGKPKKDILLRASYLLENDYLSRSGDFLTINDRVFGFWLKSVYQEKERSLTFDSRNQKAAFKGLIRGLIDEFLRHSQKPVREQISELMGLFQDETIQVEKKRLRLDRFREIRPLRFSGLGDGLIGRSQESLWIMAIKGELITEDDIVEFARECKKYRHKLQRKIILNLEDIDANARLRAMDEKIWTWDLIYINRLLDLYSRPRIIL